MDGVVGLDDDDYFFLSLLWFSFFFSLPIRFPPTGGDTLVMADSVAMDRET